MNMDEGMMQRHMAPIPAEYADVTSPVAADAGSLDRGRAIYEANCAACHGEGGWGDGPAGASLDPAPAPVAHTAQMLSDAYLFYWITEGGNFAPFSSAMPSWKGKLDETERWDVINYLRSLGSSDMMGDGMMNGGEMMEGRMMGGNVMGGDMMSWMMAPWWFLGWALVIGLAAAVVLVIVWTVRRSGGSARPTEKPLEILKLRYVRGEITSDQFEQMKRQLIEG